MQYMILIYSNEQDWAALSDTEIAEVMAAYAKYSKSLADSGVLRGGSQLTPSNSAVTVRLRDSKVLRTDGPFAETKEHLGGYYVIEVPHLDEALKWAAKCPSASVGSIEVRALARSAEQSAAAA